MACIQGSGCRIMWTCWKLPPPPPQDRAKEIDLESGNIRPTKTLGVLREATDDWFKFCLTKPVSEQKITKRSFLRATAKVFDSLGFVAPFVIRAKLCLQEMWQAELDWDQELTPDLMKQTSAWFEEFSSLGEIHVPTCIVHMKCGTPCSSSLHVFVASKSQVAPLTAISIRRLKLMAAVVAVNLAASAVTYLGISMDNVSLWSDSSNVLHWISNHSRVFKPFVAARVGDIQQQTKPCQWRHIPT